MSRVREIHEYKVNLPIEKQISLGLLNQRSDLVSTLEDLNESLQPDNEYSPWQTLEKMGYSQDS